MSWHPDPAWPVIASNSVSASQMLSCCVLGATSTLVWKPSENNEIWKRQPRLVGVCIYIYMYYTYIYIRIVQFGFHPLNTVIVGCNLLCEEATHPTLWPLWLDLPHFISKFSWSGLRRLRLQVDAQVPAAAFKSWTLLIPEKNVPHAW